MRLRICLIASSRFPVREPFMGGLEGHTHALAAELIGRGHEVSVFAAPGSDERLGATELPVPRFVTSDAARSDVGSSPEEWMQEHHAYLGLMLDLAAGVHGRFDVVHNNSLHHLPVAMARALDVPVVTTLHTPPVPWLESAAALAPASVHYVAVSHHTAAAWRHAVDARVVHNGVDTRRWADGPGGGPAVWTGRIVPEKAPHEAIDAARLAGVPLELAGPVHDVGYYRDQVEPRLRGDVRYVGHLDRDGLVRLVGAARVAVVTPRWDEPFGLVAAEALSCGTPVAAYATGALPEIVDPASGRLAPVGDVPALAGALLDAARLPRSGARERATARFDIARMADAYEELYREVGALRRVA